VILIFVGLKMVVSHWFHLNTYISLAIILGILAVAIVASINRTSRGQSSELPPTTVGS
jgi:tellurite resistance protein TerC